MKLSFITNHIRANTIIPIFIISYNHYTFVKDMVEQLEKYVPLDHIHVLDNKSTYPKLIEYLKSIENKIHVHWMDSNYGHNVISKINEFTTSTKYIITDPDLLINSNIPSNFIQILSSLSDTYYCKKIGFALDISGEMRNDKLFKGFTPKEWESQYWKKHIHHEKYELYEADVDTTFCLVNLRNSKNDIRIAGNFTCIHRPWMIGWENDVPEEEMIYYRKNNVSSSWI